MGDLSVNFSNEREMRSSYREFLEGFVSDPGCLVLVEEDDGVWKSALRADSCGGGCWFIMQPLVGRLFSIAVQPIPKNQSSQQYDIYSE